MKDIAIRLWRVIRGLFNAWLPDSNRRRLDRFDQDIAEWDKLSSSQSPFVPVETCHPEYVDVVPSWVMQLRKKEKQDLAWAIFEKEKDEEYEQLRSLRRRR